MMLKDNWQALDQGTKGDWAFDSTEKFGLMIVVRWGEKEENCCALYLDKDKAPAGKPVWTWNGNRESPTLTPSIRVLGGKNKPHLWHGYLTDGKLIDA